MIDRTVDALSLVLVADKGKDGQISSLDCIDQCRKAKYPMSLYYVAHVHVENYDPDDILVFNDYALGFPPGASVRVREVLSSSCQLVLENGRRIDPLVGLKEWIDKNPLTWGRMAPWNIYSKETSMTESGRLDQPPEKSSNSLVTEHEDNSWQLLLKEALAGTPRFVPEVRDSLTHERFVFRNHGKNRQYWRVELGRLRRLSIRDASLTKALDSAFAIQRASLQGIKSGIVRAIGGRFGTYWSTHDSRIRRRAG
jgi:hypothetical protein